MKRALIVWLLLAGSATAYERLQGPTELLYWNKEKAFNGYTLFGVGGRSYLIDMEGRVVHTWPLGTNPHLLDSGNLLDATRDDPSGFQGFQEVDWDGKKVWEYTEKRPNYAPHHDWVRIFNKNLGAPTTLYIANKTVTSEQALAAGADPQKGPYREGQMDAVVEVDMQGNVVWEWWFFDHVVQDLDPTKANYVGQGKSVADYPGRININMPGRPLKRDWLHCNSLDYSAESGQIVINSVQGELYVIDHDGTFVAGDPQASIQAAAGPVGDFLYRFGDPARYGQGEPPRVLENWDSATSGHKQMGGAHDAHWIRPGLAGAGHLMVFNNGQYLYQRTPQSSILEINPFLDADEREAGEYVNPPAAGYRRETYDHDTHNEPRQISKQIVWCYRSANSHNFFSHIGSSAQRLPNGNTLICSDTEGHFFEVTAAGELVWEYINPVTRDGAVKVLGDVLPMTNSVFRAYRYAADHPALKGRDLTPGGTITDRVAQGIEVLPKRRPPGAKPDGQPRGKRDAAGDGDQPPRDNAEPQAKRPGTGGTRGNPSRGRPRGFGRSHLAGSLDADGDGVLSTAEVNSATAALKSLDKNGDGKLTADEIDDPANTVAPDGRRRRPGEPLMRVLSTSAEDGLSAEEILNATAAVKAADLNKDGELTPEEVDAVRGSGGGNRDGGSKGGGRRGGQDRPEGSKSSPEVEAPRQPK